MPTTCTRKTPSRLRGEGTEPLQPLLSPALQLLAALLLLAAVGCKGLDLQDRFDFSRHIPWKPQSHDENEAVEKVIATWTDTVLHQPGKAPVRGFGGRLMFYGRDFQEPIKARGQLVVYGFVEKPDEPPSTIPQRKFIFPAEQFEKHYSESEVGHSYSVWLPWDEVGGPQLKVRLIARFEPITGGMVVSESAPQLLPGRPASTRETSNQQAERTALPTHDAKKSATGGATKSTVRPVSYEAEQPTSAAAQQNGHVQAVRDRMRTATISLPKNFAQRFAADFEEVSLAPETKTAPSQGQAQNRRDRSTNPEATARAGSRTGEPPRLPAEASPKSNLSEESTDSRRARLRAQGTPISEPRADRGPWQPYRARPRLRPEP